LSLTCYTETKIKKRKIKKGTEKKQICSEETDHASQTTALDHVYYERIRDNNILLFYGLYNCTDLLLIIIIYYHGLK